MKRIINHIKDEQSEKFSKVFFHQLMPYESENILYDIYFIQITKRGYLPAAAVFANPDNAVNKKKIIIKYEKYDR